MDESAPRQSRPDDPVPAPRRRGWLMLAVALTATAVVTVDQLVKIWAVQRLTGREPIVVIEGWFQLRLIRNPGAAFSLSTGTTWVFTLIAAVVVVVIVRTTRRLGSRWWAAALGLLLGGAIGNLIDRLLRAPGFGRGHVVDMFEYLRFPFIDFPVFNVADSSIVSAALLISVLGLIGLGLDGRRVGALEPAAERGGRPVAERDVGSAADG